LQDVGIIRLPILAVIVSIAASAAAAAAPDPQGLFVEVRLGQDRDDTRPDYAISGTTRRIGGAVGFDWGRSGVELGVTVPEWHAIVHERTALYVGPSGLQQQGHVYESIETERRRSIDVTVMYRLNVPIHRRATFTWLAGVGQVYRPNHTSSTLNEILPDGTRRNVYAVSRTSDRDYLAAITRLDADVRIAGPLWIGPRLSLTMYPSLLDESGLAPRGFMGRAELAMRWRF
jgi:hypothetical protein